MDSGGASANQEQLVEQIKAMAPWHHDIELFDGFSTGKVFSPDGKLKRDEAKSG